MGMGLEHELTVRYAAGSLRGTLGRLEDSLRRLARAWPPGYRERTGEAAFWLPEEFRLPGPSSLTTLNQYLRLMTDAWQSRRILSPGFGRLDSQLERQKLVALDYLSGRPSRHPAEYHRLALALDRLSRLPTRMVQVI